MNRRYKIMAGFLILLLAGLVIIEASKPQEINWFPSYSQSSKIPLGTYIFYDLLKENMEKTQLEPINIPAYELLNDSLSQGTYFFLNKNINFDPAETKSLLQWVSNGNTLFVSATYQSKKLLDTLDLEVASFYNNTSLVRKPLLNLTNPQLKRELPYFMDKDLGSSYFKSIDTASTTVLGVYDIIRDEDSSAIKEPKVNFVKVPFEKGNIYLHLFPQAFSNYFMLEDDNSNYTEGLLAYIPQEKTIFLDQYYKNGKTYQTSPLFLIFSNKHLKWAYYTLLFIALLWVIFEGKRKQRSIPIIKPLPNQTLDFTRTIAGMYLEEKDHKQIAQHQINHFLDYVRNRFHIATTSLDEKFIQDLALKSKKPPEEVKKLTNLIVYIRQQPEITEDDLVNLNKKIEKFKEKS